MRIGAKAFLVLSALALPAAVVAAADAGPVDAKGEARLAKLLEGRVAGPPTDCLQLRAINGTDVIDRTAIVYRVGDRLYVNRPDSGRAFLTRDTILLTDTRTSQLCDVDIVRLIDQGSRIPRGSVGLGRFVPYTRAPGG